MGPGEECVAVRDDKADRALVVRVRQRPAVKQRRMCVPMSSLPLVSLIIPAYNQGKFVAETIKSVLSQGYDRTEVLVLDDGSTDETPEVIRGFCDRGTAVRHDNMGENPTVNRGLEMAQGDIVCIVNADDPLLPGAVEAAVATLADDPTALAAYPDWLEIDPLGHVTRTVHLPDYDLGVMLAGFNVALGPGVFLRREALERVGKRNPALRYTGDLDYWFRVAMLDGLRHIPAVLATHRVHPQAASSAAQGRLMAEEVLRLVQVALRNPGLPRGLRSRRYRFLSTAHSVASHYCGADASTRARYERLARWYGYGARVHRRLMGLPKPGPSPAPREELMESAVHYHTLYA